MHVVAYSCKNNFKKLLQAEGKKKKRVLENNTKLSRQSNL